MIVIGKTREIYKDPNLPTIKSLISKEPIGNKKKILEYLRNGRITAAAAGTANDIITGKTIDEPFCMFTDGVYAWRSDTIYYVDKYNLKLEDEFINHVLN